MEATTLNSLQRWFVEMLRAKDDRDIYDAGGSPQGRHFLTYSNDIRPYKPLSRDEVVALEDAGFIEQAFKGAWCLKGRKATRLSPKRLSAMKAPSTLHTAYEELTRELLRATDEARLWEQRARERGWGVAPLGDVTPNDTVSGRPKAGRA